jgi:hypothetical protein
MFNQIFKLRQERHRNMPLLTELCSFVDDGLQRCCAYGAKNAGQRALERNWIFNAAKFLFPARISWLDFSRDDSIP